MESIVVRYQGLAVGLLFGMCLFRPGGIYTPYLETYFEMNKALNLFFQPALVIALRVMFAGVIIAYALGFRVAGDTTMKWTNYGLMFLGLQILILG